MDERGGEDGLISPLHLGVIGFVGGSLRSQSCIVSSYLLGNKRGVLTVGWPSGTSGPRVAKSLER